MSLNQRMMQEVLKKLKFKGQGIILYAPTEIEQAFVDLTLKTSLDKSTANANVVVFINNKKEFLDFLTNQLKYIEPDSVLWFAYPKGSSKVKTDINRDLLWEIGETFGITTVAAISINDTWSALRFRPIEKVGH